MTDHDPTTDEQTEQTGEQTGDLTPPTPQSEPPAAPPGGADASATGSAGVDHRSDTPPIPRDPDPNDHPSLEDMPEEAKEGEDTETLATKGDDAPAGNEPTE